jgi:hypothetical protein
MNAIFANSLLLVIASGAKQSSFAPLDCFVAALLAMTKQE